MFSTRVLISSLFRRKGQRKAKYPCDFSQAWSEQAQSVESCCFRFISKQGVSSCTLIPKTSSILPWRTVWAVAQDQIYFCFYCDTAQVNLLLENNACVVVIHGFFYFRVGCWEGRGTCSERKNPGLSCFYWKSYHARIGSVYLCIFLSLWSVQVLARANQSNLGRWKWRLRSGS